MTKVERSITIKAPVEKVFSYISSPNNQLEWLPSITEVRDITGQGVGPRCRDVPMRRTRYGKKRENHKKDTFLLLPKLTDYRYLPKMTSYILILNFSMLPKNV